MGLGDAAPAKGAPWMVPGHVAIASKAKVLRDTKGSASEAGHVYRGVSGVAFGNAAEGASKLVAFGPL